jgi:hypothetical protein
MLTRDQREESLIVFYFGHDEDYLTRCREHAYRDFQRTLRGIAKLARAEEAYSRADEALQLTAIRDTAAPTQEHFDTWHRSTCSELAAIYEDCGYSFTVGQAQKWINMTLKYIYVMGDARVPGFGHLYDLCHVPLDRILMDALLKYGFEPLPCAWSSLNDYDIYLDRHHWVRSRFPVSPLDVEFKLWMGQPLTLH